MKEVKEHQLLSDNPVTLERDDKFGFMPYVKILENGILNTESLPFTVGIFGGWGTGKTSLMHLLCNWLDRYPFSWRDVPGADNEGLLSSLRDDFDIAWAENVDIRKSNGGKTIRIVNDGNSAKIRINKKKEKATLKISARRTYNLKVKKENGKLYLRRDGYNTIWFNPWKYDNKEMLWTALIRSIILKIHNEAPKRKLKKNAETLLQDIALFAFKVGISTATRGVISPGDIEKMKKTMANQSVKEPDFLNTFESKFSQLVDDFVGEKGRLVVFIDDLDRCLPENAITILESLKLYLDNPHCVFVLGMDRAIIELAIKDRYGEGVQLSGREYLEKIVQLPFFLPPIPFENLRQVLQSQSKAADYASEIWDLLYYGLGENPRKVKRFVNSFYMAQGALKYLEDNPSMDDKTGDLEGVSDEDQLFYLAKVLVILMSYPEFYDYLLINPSGWDNYEAVMNFEHKEEVSEQYSDLELHWQNRQLRSFMQKTSGGDFPHPPSHYFLERILRFTGIIERREYAEGERNAREEEEYKEHKSFHPPAEEK